MKRILVAAIAGLVAAPAALAGDLVYTPINPSFGGNPLYSPHLMGLASAQRTATAPSRTSLDDGPPTTPGTSDADLFVRQLQGRLLSALAAQVTEAIFGATPQDYGEITFGDTNIVFERTMSSITLTISDATGVTQIVVPQLVTSQ